MMKRYLPLFALALALAFFLNRKSAAPLTQKAAALLLSEASSVSARTPAGTTDLPAAPSREDNVMIPTFFPKAKVIAKVVDPIDGRGRQRVIETVETSMKEPYVRVERTFQRTGQGKRGQVGGEVAMVSNQLLLEKPDSLDKATFVRMLHQAGAREVTEIGEAFLATFAAAPSDPRALDSFMSRVKEVAGADVIVEPNYIRKLF